MLEADQDGEALRSWGKNLGQGQFHFMCQFTNKMKMAGQ